MTLSTSDERKAERILLRRLIDMPQKDRVPYLQSIGVSSKEFKELWTKYERWIKTYMQYKEKKIGKHKP